MSDSSMLASFCGIQVIENAQCLRNYELSDFTKKLMGTQWVLQFDQWACYALPNQPAMYMFGKDRIVAHPRIVKRMLEIGNVKK